MSHIKRVLRMFLVILIGLPLTAHASFADPSSQVSEQQQATLVVGRYLAAWVKGDYATMYSLWDAESQSKITERQLVNAFKVEGPGTEQEKAQMRKAWGVDYLITGRPAKIDGFHVRLLADNRAVADCIAEFSAGSEYGMDQLFVHPDFLKELAKPDPADNGMKGFFVPLTMALMLETSSADTSQGQTKTVYGIGGPPYIALHLRRYLLVRENNSWRIANAVTVSDEPLNQAQQSAVGVGKTNGNGRRIRRSGLASRSTRGH